MRKKANPQPQDYVPRMVEITHVIPLNDIREHDADIDCWCRPQQDDDTSTLYVHNSADGREDFEEGRRLPS